jgi:hypothetical protein
MLILGQELNVSALPFGQWRCLYDTSTHELILVLGVEQASMSIKFDVEKTTYSWIGNIKVYGNSRPRINPPQTPCIRATLPYF